MTEFQGWMILAALWYILSKTCNNRLQAFCALLVGILFSVLALAEALV